MNDYMIAGKLFHLSSPEQVVAAVERITELSKDDGRAMYHIRRIIEAHAERHEGVAP